MHDSQPALATDGISHFMFVWTHGINQRDSQGNAATDDVRALSLSRDELEMPTASPTHSCCKDSVWFKGGDSAGDPIKRELPGIALDKRIGIQQCIKDCGCFYGEDFFGLLDNYPNIDLGCHKMDGHSTWATVTLPKQTGAWADSKRDGNDAIPRDAALTSCAADPQKLACRFRCVFSPEFQIVACGLCFLLFFFSALVVCAEMLQQRAPITAIRKRLTRLVR